MPRSDFKDEVKNNFAVVPSVEQFVKLVERVRKSKHKAEADACFAQVVEGLKPRIKNLCAKFNISGLSYDDIYQEALYALRFKAIKDYDKTRGTVEGVAPFDRFAMLCIRRHLATELKTSHQVRKTALNTAISLDQERSELNDDLSLINILPHSDGDILNVVERREYYSKLVSKLMTKLSSFEKDVFLLYIEKYTYEEIAEIINRHKVGRSRINIKGVDNALSRIKNKASTIFHKFGDKDVRERTSKLPPQKTKSRSSTDSSDSGVSYVAT